MHLQCVGDQVVKDVPELKDIIVELKYLRKEIKSMSDLLKVEVKSNEK